MGSNIIDGLLRVGGLVSAIVFLIDKLTNPY
jgi:hypothetical protein